MDSALWGVVGGVLSALIVIWGSRKTQKASAEHTQMQTLSAALNQLGVTVEELLGAFQKITALEKAMGMKNDYIIQLEEEIADMRALKDYVKSLLDYLKGKGLTDYPEPPSKLLDTNPKIKKSKQ